MVDGTRGTTLATALNLKDMAENAIGQVPSLFLLNKADLKAEWELNPDTVLGLKEQDITVMETSAKTRR